VRVGLGLLARDLEPEVLQHAPIDPIRRPVDLRRTTRLPVGRWASSGRLDIAQIPGATVDLRTEGLTAGHQLRLPLAPRRLDREPPQLP
jgi:hypothetical protein